MASYPAPIEQLIDHLVRLPGIGRRGAERLVTHLLASPTEQVAQLGAAIGELRGLVRSCSRCGAWSEGEFCEICEDPARDGERVCVVERPADVYAFEESGAFNGRYHVLGGTLSPLHGVGPDDLNIERFVRRVGEEGLREAILALSPTVEGDATALYLARRIESADLEVTRIGLGLPLGASLGYADPGTLRLALEGRRKIDSR